MSLLITDIHYFPRSEYYTRFEGTTAFDMDDPDYWGSYHRSESSRFFDVAGGRKATQFASPCIEKSPGANSFFAHSGGYCPPLNTKEYSKVLKGKKVIDIGTVNIHDQLLCYKNRMARVIVESFEKLERNEQKYRKKYGKKNTSKSFYSRPIVYTENDYPCVLVALPVLNSAEIETEAAKYWEEHPKPFQQLLLSSFVAFLNVEAVQAGIPIEMVMRASFGHNQPSVCGTNNSFRINVGVIPESYAELIGKTLHQLNKAINAITDKKSSSFFLNEKFLKEINLYNAKKLKKAINGNDRYKRLKQSRDFQKVERSPASFQKLYDEFKEINEKTERRGKAVFMPINLENKIVWEVIRATGDSMGKSVLAECFRKQSTVEWFANQLMDNLSNSIEDAIEKTLEQLLYCLSYGECVTMNYKKIHRDLRRDKRQFTDPSFTPFYNKDVEFSKITNLLCEALLIKRPSQALYAALEQAGMALLSTYRSSEEISAAPDFGSDSEFSDELTDEENASKSHHISHIKLRVCSGMKAILLAQYGAFSYLRQQGRKTYAQDTQQMYYEVGEALTYVSVDELAINKVRAATDSMVLHFDLNHCNSSNADDNETLKRKLLSLNPTVVVLDYTSSTIAAMEIALHCCFSNKNVELVMLVESGLKNNQGGLDFNPYGEVRICGRNRRTTNDLWGLMKKGLSEQDKLSPGAHGVVRLYKKRGMAVSLYGLFKTKEDRFQGIEEQDLSVSKIKGARSKGN